MLSRREFLRISGLSGTLAALAACNPLKLGAETSDKSLSNASATPIPIRDEHELVLHTLRRATFGPTAKQLESARQVGLQAWLDEQLSPDAHDESEVEHRLINLETYAMSPIELRDLQQNSLVARELVAGTILRQIYSPAQLYEVMADFWTNHFNIHAFSVPELFLKGQDDREVVRPHALGKFPDLPRQRPVAAAQPERELRARTARTALARGRRRLYLQRHSGRRPSVHGLVGRRFPAQRGSGRHVRLSPGLA
jgi:hypothetical protein